ncbi:MAG TPA: ATP-grasp domain-containing protein [Xanthobacteraceae bacterium]
MARPPAVLIAAASGRALAQSARQGGYVPLVADFFADQDTVALAQAHVRIEHGLARGMDEEQLIAAFEILARAQEPIGVVCGTGFEDRPHLLARIARRWRLLGNDPGTVATIKDPLAFAALCRDGAIAHPPITTAPPANASGWLAKRRGGAGGSHIAAPAQHGDGETYFQREVAGMPVSALFLADGARATTLGFSTQWASPTAARPFRYGGAVRPATLAADISDALVAAVQRIATMVPLVGLNSADFLVDGVEFWLLEINPRPGATLDIFEPAKGSLFALHIAACEGELSNARPSLDGASAAAIVYADRDIASFPALPWPAWSADRPRPGTSIRSGEPLCTVMAAGASASAAKALVDERLATVLAWTRAT